MIDREAAARAVEAAVSLQQSVAKEYGEYPHMSKVIEGLKWAARIVRAMPDGPSTEEAKP